MPRFSPDFYRFSLLNCGLNGVFQTTIATYIVRTPCTIIVQKFYKEIIMTYYKVIETTGREICLIWDDDYLADFITGMEKENKKFIVIKIEESEVYRTE